MTQRDSIRTAIYEVIDEINKELPAAQQLEKSSETVLFGQNAKLDSLGLVSLVVATEQKIEDTYGKPVVLTDERAMSQRNSPFRSVATLVEYIDTLLNES